MEKKCTKCGQIKEIELFSRYKEGYKTKCKSCCSIAEKERRVKNGGKNHLDKSLETEELKLCTKCTELKSRILFSPKSSWCNSCKVQYEREKNNWKKKFIPIVNGDSKQCCKCLIIKSLEDYTDSKRGRLGKATYCKSCSLIYQLSRPKDKKRKYTQKYRDNNREWWRSLHRINQFNRRNKIILVSDGSVTPEFAKSIYSESICYYCEDETPEKFRTLEHKLPLNRGGEHSSKNIVMACLCCNSSKRDKTEEEFLKFKEENNVKN
jgi:hypothetical protein